MTNSYLLQLVLSVAQGLEPEVELRERQAKWLKAQQQDDGGFAGRDGPSDLYYSAFALRSLAVLGELQGEVADQAANFLSSRLHGNASVIDLISLVLSAKQLDMSAGIDPLASAGDDWQANVLGLLEQLRTADGGYAKTIEGAAASTYQSFLALLVYQLLEETPPEPASLRDFLLSQQREDGGFVEIRVMKRSGVNPTAAAIGGLKLLEAVFLEKGATLPALSLDISNNAAEFLLEMQNEEGGVPANTRIPIADLLSTFTAMQSLHTLGRLDEFDQAAARKFAQSVEQPTGGFLAAAWDQIADVEYTFYGLGVLGLCGQS
ncbi:prenyltransferase/squalene oxidase repeat-containing protein [Adhaeretor mobilis]|uniref:Geranylgeranyl transferase type II subunit beta n=1 Tax=Adhaeretor mobilis TaxID=1930276 RepID=A0A517N202_9BACT|nr:prenyltransferase/squalene oxidase repeat-containing protein [Adhaeretor mobilis]QDT01160.1 Prenyltransferase and squalene oxidase repeat protein [Adhaeretor mobilis]